MAARMRAMAAGTATSTAMVALTAATLCRSCPVCPGYLIILSPKIYKSRFESDADFGKKKGIIQIKKQKNVDKLRVFA